MTGKTGFPIEENFFERCKSVTERYEKIWGRWSSDAQLLHIITEVCEVRDVLRNKNEKYGPDGSPEWKQKFLDENADVFLTAFAACGFFGISVKDINFAILNKLMEVEKRVEEDEKNAKEFGHDIVKKISRGDVKLK